MVTLRIRENFHPAYHKYSSIQDFDLKWESILKSQLEQKGEIKIKCSKINDELNCLLVKKDNESIYLETSYLIGLDYISKDLSVMVEPKFDSDQKAFSIDFYKILFESLPYVKFSEDVSNIYHVDFSKPKIEINQKDDFLTPILVVQYISYLDNICHRGLQKGYYWVENNLSNKVKGKILVKETMKGNHLKSNYNKTYCRYQEFGVDTLENKYLKFAFQFCINYLNQFNKLKIISNFESRIGFIKSSLEKLTLETSIRNPIQIKKNPLFPAYESALKLANLILKRNAFNITNTTSNKIETYPYWIDMSKLFELHVLKLLRKSFKEGVYYQKEYNDRIPDIILNIASVKAVIDVKYKDYTKRSVDIEDIRQVAAYARMKPIFSNLNMRSNEILDGIIIYPRVESKQQSLNLETLNMKTELDYHNIYKLDVSIPVINND
jgi:5-methylcytosine-specific restriction enzyme subunit McrC